MSKYAGHVTTTPQSEPLPGQVANSAGGFSWAVDCWTRLDRFLILGSEGNTYYASERKLSKENAKAIEECAAQDINRTVNRIAQVSVEGLAPKNDPAIFALALLARHPEAQAKVCDVCRTGTHLFQYVEDVNAIHKWSRSRRRAVSTWYTSKMADSLAYSVAKYAQRNGWSHHDVMHKVHPKPPTKAHAAVFQWVKDRAIIEDAPYLLEVVNSLRGETDNKVIAKLVRDHNLPREVLQTESLNSLEVWDALLEKMPLTAMIRNLGKMTSIKLITPLSKATAHVVGQLMDPIALKKARIHPLSVLMALSTYKSGRGLRGSLTWSPDSSVIGGLDDAFYGSFTNIVPTGKRWMMALDVSGSMTCGNVGGSSLSPRDASAAMAMVTVRTEPMTNTVGFCHTLKDLKFTKTMGLLDAIKVVDCLPFGGTDCALPMVHAKNNKIPVDVFCVITDSETWFGGVHPAKALEEYRSAMGIPAKLVVMGMVANEFTIANPNDPGMLDVVGFDASVPDVMRQFVLA